MISLVSSMLMIRFKGENFPSNILDLRYFSWLALKLHVCLFIRTDQMRLWPKEPTFHRFSPPELLLFFKPWPQDCGALLCEVYCCFAPNVDWPIMADCVPPGKHYPRVAHERENYASAFNVTVGSSWPLQKSFFFFFTVWGGSLSKGPTKLRWQFC